MADSPLGQRLGAAVQAIMAQAAGYLALVTQTNPRGSAEALLSRPDVDAMLSEALGEAREYAMSTVEEVWAAAGAPEDAQYRRLQADVARVFGSLEHLRGLVRHAHASVGQREFSSGLDPPGSHPSSEAAAERAEVVRTAVLGWGRTAALRARMTLSTAEGGAGSAATLADALARQAQGEQLRKRWRAHADLPGCCIWCRKLNGVTIALRDSFAPHLGGPVALPHLTARHVATPAGQEKFGMPAGSPIILTHPPRLYHGDLQGPLLHPFCRCWLEITRTGDSQSVTSGGGQAPSRRPGSPAPHELAGFLAASDVRAMPADRYQANLVFLQAAVQQLDQVLKRLAEGQ